MTTVALRTSLVWNDEVMHDVVLEQPGKITLGRSAKSTFVVPELGLPPDFAIVRPGNRGYLLTLGEHMRGTICLDGEERDVADFIRRTPGDGGFHATPISGRDWGVIQLDDSGQYKLFFQFVPVEEPAQFFTPQVIAGGAGGFVLASAALTLRWWLDDQPLDEAIFRGVGMTMIVLTIGALAWWAFLQENDQKLSLVFSIVLHLALLFTTYVVYEGDDPFVWPGSRALAGSYLVTRLEVTPPEEPKVIPTVGTVNKQEPAAPNPPQKAAVAKLDEGAHGGEGKTERARDPNAPDKPREAPKIALTSERNAREIEKVASSALPSNLDKFQSLQGPKRSGDHGFGPGSGGGVGDGKNGSGTTRGSKKGGSGGGGSTEGDHVANRGQLDTGGQRAGGGCTGKDCTGTGPREVKVTVGQMGGDPGGLTAEEINRVVMGRAGVYRACYQRELNRSPGLAGKLVVRFKIDGSGVVQSATVTGGSTLANDAVSGCVTTALTKLKFPAKGGTANVTYPFLFAPGA